MESRRIDRSTATPVIMISSSVAASGREQVPERERREHSGEQQAYARRVHRVRRLRVASRHLQLAHDEERDADEESDRHPDLRREPAAVDRVAKEEHSSDQERRAGDPREQLDADQTLPVKWRLGRCRRRRRNAGPARRRGRCVTTGRRGCGGSGRRQAGAEATHGSPAPDSRPSARRGALGGVRRAGADRRRRCAGRRGGGGGDRRAAMPVEAAAARLCRNPLRTSVGERLCRGPCDESLPAARNPPTRAYDCAERRLSLRPRRRRWASLRSTCSGW